MSSDRTYRTNVGAVLVRGDGLVLVCERIGTPGSWQLPQGGVEPGEAMEAALWREVEEELGLSPPQRYCALLGHGPAVRYDFPPGTKGKHARGFAGQEQTLYALRFTGPDEAIDVGAHTKAEFRAVRWVPLEEAVRLLWAPKRRVLEATIEALPQVLRFDRQSEQ